VAEHRRMYPHFAAEARQAGDLGPPCSSRSLVPTSRPTPKRSAASSTSRSNETRSRSVRDQRLRSPNRSAVTCGGSGFSPAERRQVDRPQ
jgi:hypothetical protein